MEVTIVSRCPSLLGSGFFMSFFEITQWTFFVHMNEIEAYFQLPDSHRLYSTGLALLQKYGLPQFSTQYTQLSAGPRGNNRTLLELLLRGLVPKPSAAPPTFTANTSKNQEPQRPVEEIDLLLALRRLRQERSQLSQQFHSCDSDTDRAAVCDRIEAQNLLIATQMGKVAYFQRYRKLPPEGEDEADMSHDLPDNITELEAMRSRLSSRILKIEKRIETLLSFPENSRKRADLPKKQKQLTEALARRSAVRAKLRELREKEKGNK